MAYMFSLKDRYQSFKKDNDAYEQSHSKDRPLGDLELPNINSLGSSSKFRKDKAKQYKYDRNQRTLKERKLINFQRRSIEKMHLKAHSNSKIDYGLESTHKDKTSHYFNDDKEIKILRMDSVNTSKDNSFNNRMNSRNSAVKTNVTYVQNTISSINNIVDNSSKVFFNSDQTPKVNERANMSVDENVHHRRVIGSFILLNNSCIANRDKTVNNKIPHEGIFAHDPKYMSSIIQSKSLTNDLKFSTLASKNVKAVQNILRNPSNGINPDNYDLDSKFMNESEFIIPKDEIENSDQLYVERRKSESLKTKDKERKYYSNNNSIIELQKIDDRRIVTCKTRVIPNSE